MTDTSFLLTVVCPDRIGIVAAVSQFLCTHSCNIEDSSQFGDRGNGTFFMRIAFAGPPGLEKAQLERNFAPIAEDYRMEAVFHDARRKIRTLIMASKASHCLVDLLYRQQQGSLPIEIAQIVSNHPDGEAIAHHYGAGFTCLPVTPDTKLLQEAALVQLIESHSVDLVVLARYMQILSAEFCAALPGRIINIHHSFLPSFKGAHPYRQAHERGVKLIGATAHYVTAQLDEGPIIEQDVHRVNHQCSVAECVEIGRDIERVVLARAVKWHAEHRILLNGTKTIVFA